MLHLESGRPLFSLPLSPTHTVHGDINSDGTIDHVHAVVNPGEGKGRGTLYVGGCGIFVLPSNLLAQYSHTQ